MRNWSRKIAAFGAIAFVAGGARAQSEGPDVASVPPNVLLLVDTSGSMEWKSASRLPPNCVPALPNTGASTDQNEKSRWIEMTEVLTGTIANYSCFSESRSSTPFSDEFSIVQGAVTNRPIDWRYIDDYHRPMSNQCAPGPGDLPTNPWEWPTNPIKYRAYQAGSIAATNYCAAGTFSQANDGLLDAFSGLMRFGLMTFDTEVDAGTGVTGADTTYGVVKGTASYKAGIQGGWSYYLPDASGCKRTGSTGSGFCTTKFPDGSSSTNPDGCCAGGPTNCVTLLPQEAGARNAAAPPWEGRMVAFGPPADDGSQRNQWIQQILLATRPYGATPIAGMLHDAQDFFWNDKTTDPLNPTSGFAPPKDPQEVAGCRDNYIVLLTDGEPNLDLRTACEGSPNNCPFDKPEDITNQLMRPTDPTKAKVRTFVVGFALDTVTVGGSARTCASIKPNDPACATATGALKVCCTLNNIAYNGTPTADQPSVDPNVINSAIYPKNASELRTALSKAFSTTLANTTTRTYPVVMNTPLADTTAAGYQFTSGANVAGNYWKGILSRQRIQCTGIPLAPTPQAASTADGDDFIANVNSNPTARTLFTVGPPSGATTWNAGRSVRPYFETALEDGVLHGSGTPTVYFQPVDMKTYVSSTMMNVSAATCGTATAGACSSRLSDWIAGLPTATPATRCPLVDTDKCNVIGDIFHSTPQIRPGIPSDFLRDDTYATFAGLMKQRDSVLYTATNDGFFHGFLAYPGKNVSTRKVTTKTPNELWAFMPPAVLPFVASMYPAGTNTTINRIPVLDGMPVLADVGATKGGSRALNSTTTSTLYYPYRLERKRFPLAGETHTWRTISAQSFGSKQSGYYALDVTQPTIDTTDSSSGPRFLWQLTTDDNGKQIFGKGTPAPLITTLYVNLSALGVSTGETTREVPVAVLAGGLGDTTPTGSGCGPGPSATIQVVTEGGPTTSSFTRQTRCYNNSPANIAARSLTIVRLDTGQILRTFRPTLPAGFTQPVTFQSSVLTTQEIPAPIVGVPAAYPAQTGQIADRIFVGDAEGRMWRVDVSNPNPASWTMQVFFDAYYDLSASGIIPQAIETQPVLSVDGKGQITLAFATGSQDNLSPDASLVNYAASVTEYIANVAGGSKEFWSQINWRQTFSVGTGERVLGPMTLFDRRLYFSTYIPPATTSGVCVLGSSKVYGEDYILKQGAIASAGGLATTGFPIAVDGIVAGVGLRQLPSCTKNLVTTDSTDDFLGYGKSTSMTSSTPGNFELFIQKSGTKGGTPTTIPTQAVAVTSPRIPVRIDSWAPIIE
jgi:type IV pilus assembly protein PilY1